MMRQLSESEHQLLRWCLLVVADGDSVEELFTTEERKEIRELYNEIVRSEIQFIPAGDK